VPVKDLPLHSKESCRWVALEKRGRKKREEGGPCSARKPARPARERRSAPCCRSVVGRGEKGREDTRRPSKGSVARGGKNRPSGTLSHAHKRKKNQGSYTYRLGGEKSKRYPINTTPEEKRALLGGLLYTGRRGSQKVPDDAARTIPPTEGRKPPFSPAESLQGEKKPFQAGGRREGSRDVLTSFLLGEERSSAAPEKREKERKEEI